MHWLLIGYMFLFIDRPFEVWPWLGDIHIERIYMLLTMAVWAVYPDKRWLPNMQHAAYAAFAIAVAGCWAMSPYAEKGQPIVEDWFKIVVFYVMLVTTVHDEKGLQRMAVGFVSVMAIYLLHSFREFLGGRHTHRMGIVRMIGVDTTLGNPNSFGASIIYALPMVTALWRAEIGGRRGRWLLMGYVGLSCLCVLLTGSRSSLLGLMLWFTVMIMGHRRRFTFLAAFALCAPAAFIMLPEKLQNRFETIIDSDVGPANAKESGEGRIEGFLVGMQLWSANPLNGVGPGAWRPATGSKVEAHNLYGQLVGEMGTIGFVTFLAIVLSYFVNAHGVKRIRKAVPEWKNDLVFQLPSAIHLTVFLLLFMGIFGHNLFRFTWLWYGGFLIIARYCVSRRLADAAYADAEPEEETQDEWEHEEVEGWVRHPSHAFQ